ncbi:tetratricopeptide repeat protein [Polaromonas sp.]|jgi:tetratricopeptide (TPR) repeat protein|uniref:tetratricopeptide repeat protein n=1 Tax=Polaromonas sp. TaxID=1869339 RepID=UPI0037C6909C
MELENLIYCNEAILQIGRQHLRARRWREAETLATGWLKRQPASGDAFALRGFVCLANGHTAAAEGFIQNAVTCDPHSSYAYLVLAQLYLHEEKTDEALLALRRALALDPAESEASCLLAGLLAARGDAAGAERGLRSALAVSPCNASVHFALAAILWQLGQQRQATELVSSGLDLDSGISGGWLLRAQLASDQALWPQAQQSCERALLLEPGNPTFLFEKARISLLEGLQPGARQNALKEAEEAARQALALEPQSSRASIILGGALRASGRLDEALSVHAALVRSAPQDAVPVLEMALTHRKAGNFDAALLAVKKAVSLAPEMPSSHLVHGELLLHRGELAAGFSAMDRCDDLLRLAAPTAPTAPRLDKPITPQTMNGKKILLLGASIRDALLYARYVPLLTQMGGRISVATDPQVHFLLQSSLGICELLPLDADPQNYHHVESMTRLPALFSTDTGTVPWTGPYVSSDPKVVATLRQMFAKLPAWRVGLNLGLSPDLKLAQALAGAFRTLGLTVVVLAPLGGLEEVFDGVPLEFAENATMRQMAALIEGLDTVVTIDSLVAHMAGVLGVRCHVLLTREHEAIWGCSGESSAWYPELRLYRETAAQGWEDAVARLEEFLETKEKDSLNPSPRDIEAIK